MRHPSLQKTELIKKDNLIYAAKAVSNSKVQESQVMLKNAT